MQTQTNPVQNSILIPDCCNIGIVFRTFLFVNTSVYFALMARGYGVWLAFQEFVETSIIVNLISLLSLFVLCLLRRISLHKFMSDWGQRFLCGVVPAVICFVWLRVLGQADWYRATFPRLHVDFAVMLCLLIGMLLQHYFELRSKAFSPALGEARLQALQARIRPHFLFNSLNAVLSLIRTEPRRAENALEDLADLFRVLMRDTRAMSTLQEEIQFCERYLSIEKIRLGERLQVQWNRGNLSEKDLVNTQVASLLLQPLLENAVHYGVEPSIVPAMITVWMERSLDKIEIRISNPCFPEQKIDGGNHMALDNIRQRLALLYDIEAQLSSSIAHNIFEVKIKFPLTL